MMLIHWSFIAICPNRLFRTAISPIYLFMQKSGFTHEKARTKAGFKLTTLVS